MKRTSGAVALLALAACSRTVSPPEPASPPPTTAPTVRATPASGPTSVLEPGAWRAPTTQGAPSSPHAPHTAVASPTVTVRVVAVDAREGEDGHGNTIPATHPVAIDLETASGWPGGARATTLSVGALRFYAPGYPSLTTMRFIAADGRVLPHDGDVVVEAGALRRVVASSLPVAP